MPTPMNGPAIPSTRIPAFLCPTLPSHRRRSLHKRPPRCVSQQHSSHTIPTKRRTHMHTPVIHRYTDPSSETYAMWYTTHPPSGPSTIHLATSTDGQTFSTVEGPYEGAVLCQNDEQWWAFDTRHVAVGDVATSSSARVRADGDVVFMYYTGFSGTLEARDRFRAGEGSIGVALSKDGQYFSRIEGELPSGAVLEGEQGAFDEAGVWAPCVCSVGRKTVMYYHTHSQKQGYQIGRAESEDGILFKKSGPVLLAGDAEFASGGMLNPCVVENETKYLMFAEVVSGGRSRIALSESEDCENWGSLKLVLEDSQHSEGIGSPYALPMSDGSLRLYYTRYESNDSSLALAESEGTDWANFKTIANLQIQ